MYVYIYDVCMYDDIIRALVAVKKKNSELICICK